jgi:hypothetical protein
MAKFLWAAILAVLMGCVSSGTPHGGGADGSGDNGGGDDTAAAAVITTVVTALVERDETRATTPVSTTVYCDGEEIGVTGEEINLLTEDCKKMTVGDMDIADRDDELPVYDDGEYHWNGGMDRNGQWIAPSQPPTAGEMIFRLSRYIRDGTQVTCAYLDGSCYESGECDSGEVEYDDGDTIDNVPMLTELSVSGSLLEGEPDREGWFTSPTRWIVYQEGGSTRECWEGGGDARYD